MKQIELKALAKINLGLDVLGKRGKTGIMTSGW
jgi:4-diphosphocytidyl-2C-methyl-D-erythritol kinase